ncbi:MAG: hypothetical protein KDK74_15595 [Cephaloticoccus sp.]|nr:hypothetical protein [Cephaloticoccus sp.]
MRLITGAGVDRTTGIDFPLANTLLADVTRYLDGPGKAVDDALRAMLPGMRFSFNNMIARAVDKIGTREPHEQKVMVQRVQTVIKELTVDKNHIRKHGELIIRLFNKLQDRRLGMGRWRGGATGALSGANPAGTARLHPPQPIQNAAFL